MKRFALSALISGLALSVQAHDEVAANEMARAANALIAALTPAQQSASGFPLNHAQRLDWHFVPKDRKGTPLKEMTDEQQRLTTGLLAASLSSQGFAKAKDIMDLESLLAVIEGPNRHFSRDPGLYHVTLYGEPGPGKTWGWRFEGHHLSLSFTVVKGLHISATPSFMGANPARVKDGPRQGLQVLADEEKLGLELVNSLTAEQRQQAIFSAKAPPDIITQARRKVSPLEPAGIGWNDLTGDQRETLWKLVKLYAQRARGEIAKTDLKRITDAGQDKLRFAWAGGLRSGEGHYYRIQGPTFLIEYDNTQDNANHIHTVYRDFTGDFGEDLLQRHYDEAHR